MLLFVTPPPHAHCHLQAEQLDSMSSKELLSMLSFGADRIFAKEAGERPTDAELDAIIDRSNTKAAAAAAATADGGGGGGAAGAKEEPADGGASGSTGPGTSAAAAAAPIVLGLR